MKIKKTTKRVFAWILSVCMIVAAMYVDLGIVQAAEGDSTTVYYYNSDGFDPVYAYSYKDGKDLMSGWKVDKVTKSDIGEKWYEITVPATSNFNIIFMNEDESVKHDVYFGDTSKVYVTNTGTAYATQSEAEKAVDGTGESATSTTVYYYNSDGFDPVYAYSYKDGKDLMSGWKVDKVTKSDIGEKWYEITVPATSNFNIIFMNEDESVKHDVYFGDTSKVYVTNTGTTYASQTEAEAAINGRDEASSTTVYFYNGKNWENVAAYVWGSNIGEALGGWDDVKTRPLSSATELGDGWVEVTVPTSPTFNIVFFNPDGEGRTDAYIASADKIYVTPSADIYASDDEAENAFNNTPTIIYFLNWDGEKELFDDVYAYVEGDEDAGKQPGIKAEKATELGDYWYSVTILQNAAKSSFEVVFSDNGKNAGIPLLVEDNENNYATVNTLWASKNAAAASVGIEYETVVYYLNTEKWEKVSAYVYGACGEVLGSWSGTEAVPATELGGDWLKVTVPADPTFNIIFSNQTEGGDQDAQRAELAISNKYQTYVTGNKEDGNVAAYGSQDEAELALGLKDQSAMTTVYFYNSREFWGYDIYCWASREVKEDEDTIVEVTVGSGWPGKTAEKATELGENWYKVTIPRTPTEEDPLFVIFNDGVNQLQNKVEIPNVKTVYVTVTEKAFTSKAAAEAEAAKDTFVDSSEKGTNEDLDNYEAEYAGAGADLPYISYEAEDAKTNATKLEKDTVYRNSIQTEASGRQAVELDATGEYVEFTLTEATNTIVLRYSMPDDRRGVGLDGTLSLYVNGKEVDDLELTSKYAWVYGGYPFYNTPYSGNGHRFFDETRIMLGETLPAGTTIRLQKDAADTADYYVIDFIECELVGAPLTQPKDSLSVTDFGAVANDGKDDYKAFADAIAAAQQQDKEVWIPAGTFDLVEEKSLDVEGVTIRGAGMWYTNLYGAGASFHYKGTCKFYDFALTGVSTVRDDAGDLAGFEATGKSSNITIENIWMEHMKVGVWSKNTDGLIIQGCRIRNTYADGINLSSGTNNATVRNNSVRNTGDDCIAIWPELADSSNNTIEHNTIQVPALANGVAVYGGGNNVVDSNHIMDTIINGSGIAISSEFPAKKGYTGAVLVKNNLLERCGSYHEEGYPVGSIWIWCSAGDMTTEYNVYNNTIVDAVNVAITVECANKTLKNLNIMYNKIDGATDGIYEYRPANTEGKGSGKYFFEEGAVKNIEGTLLDDTKNPNFTWTKEEVALDASGSIQDAVTKGDVEADIDQTTADKVLAGVLTDAEKELVKKGANAWLELVSDEMKPTDAEIAAVKSVLEEKMKVGMYIDIDLFKLVGYTKTQLEELKTPVKITLTIPEELLASGRSFSMVGIHDGKAELYKDLDKTVETITVELSKFSTYALVYEDAAQAENPPQTENSPQTGDTAPMVAMTMMLVLAAGAVVVAGKRRQKSFN